MAGDSFVIESFDTKWMLLRAVFKRQKQLNPPLKRVDGDWVRSATQEASGGGR
jgi:hypothetical protein